MLNYFGQPEGLYSCFMPKMRIFVQKWSQKFLILALFYVGDEILVGEMLSYFLAKNPTKSWLRYVFTLICFATRANKRCDRFFSAAWEYECEAVNFFCQKISPEEFCWVFPLPHAHHLLTLHAWVLPGRLSRQG